MSKSARAFTLIELLIVIAIIGILSSIVISSVMSSGKKKAQDAVRLLDFRNITNALEIYSIDHGAYPMPAAPGTFWMLMSNTAAWNTNLGSALSPYFPTLPKGPTPSLPYMYVGSPIGGGLNFNLCGTSVCVHVGQPCVYLRIPLERENATAQNDGGMDGAVLEFIKGSGCSVYNL